MNFFIIIVMRYRNVGWRNNKRKKEIFKGARENGWRKRKRYRKREGVRERERGNSSLTLRSIHFFYIQG